MESKSFGAQKLKKYEALSLKLVTQVSDIVAKESLELYVRASIKDSYDISNNIEKSILSSVQNLKINFNL